MKTKEVDNLTDFNEDMGWAMDENIPSRKYSLSPSPGKNNAYVSEKRANFWLYKLEKPLTKKNESSGDTLTSEYVIVFWDTEDGDTTTVILIDPHDDLKKGIHLWEAKRHIPHAQMMSVVFGESESTPLPTSAVKHFRDRFRKNS